MWLKLRRVQEPRLKTGRPALNGGFCAITPQLPGKQRTPLSLLVSSLLVSSVNLRVSSSVKRGLRDSGTQHAARHTTGPPLPAMLSRSIKQRAAVTHSLRLERVQPVCRCASKEDISQELRYVSRSLWSRYDTLPTPLRSLHSFALPCATLFLQAEHTAARAVQGSSCSYRPSSKRRHGSVAREHPPLRLHLPHLPAAPLRAPHQHASQVSACAVAAQASANAERHTQAALPTALYCTCPAADPC